MLGIRIVRFRACLSESHQGDSQRQPSQSQNIGLHSDGVVQGRLPISCHLRKDDALAKRLQDAFDQDGRASGDISLGG